MTWSSPAAYFGPLGYGILVVNIFFCGWRLLRAAFLADRIPPALVVISTVAFLLPNVTRPAFARQQSQDKTSRLARLDNDQQVLKQRLQKHQDAVQASDPEAIIETSQQLTALALRLMGEWRLRQASYPQAAQLFRISLGLEDIAETRSGLSAAGEEAHKAGKPLPPDLDSVDTAAAPPASALKASRLTPAQLRLGNAEERRLRKLLASSYNDWGTAEAQLQKYSQAMVHFHEAERWDRSTPGLMRNIGLAAVKLGDDKEAARALRLAVQQNPEDSTCRTLLATSLFSTQQYAEAARHFDAVRDSVLADPQMTYAWAFSLSRSNQPKQARLLLAKLTAQPLSAEMLVAVGEVYSSLGDYKEGLHCFQKAVVLDPAVKKAHNDAGSALLRLDHPADAIPEFREELKINPGDPDVQYRLAYALLQTSQPDQALPLLRDIVAAHPDHARARYDLGRELLRNGKTDEAIQNLEAAAHLDPSRDYVHYQLQAAYRKAGRVQDADRELKLYREIKAHNRQRSAPQF